jgi:hypothetical protein
VDDVVIAFMKAARLWNEQSPTEMPYDGSNEDNIHRDTSVDTHQNRNKASEIYTAYYNQQFGTFDEQNSGG